MSVPIFCINLDRAEERRSKIQEHWVNGLGLGVIFWRAYDRRLIDEGRHLYAYDPNLTERTIKRQLNVGEMACATSFCMLYEYLIFNNYEEAIIMEDDVTPLVASGHELFDTIEQGKTEFPSSEIMLLHKPQWKHEFSYSKKHSSLCSKANWGNQMFYANKAGIKRLYDILKTMSCPADYPQKLLCREGIVTASNQPMCDHVWVGDDSTTYIGNDLRNTFRNFIE